MSDSFLRRVFDKTTRTLIPHAVRLNHFRKTHADHPSFVCPLCDYAGPFQGYENLPGARKHVRCPNCGAFERHRLVYLAYRDATQGRDLSQASVVHFAPEPYMGRVLQHDFGQYTTADLYMKEVDHKADLEALPFADESFDAAVVIHVMMHVEDDQKAFREIARILKPGGFAILPVPMLAPATVEYPELLEDTGGKFWRAPGPDYYDKCREAFSRVEVYASTDFPEKYQLYIYEDRTQWPTPEMPLRPRMEGERHLDLCPVCYK